MTHYRCRLSDYQFLESLLDEIGAEVGASLNDQTRWLFKHLLVSQLSGQARDNDGFVPISTKLIEREIGRKHQLPLLIKSGIIGMTPHSRSQRKSREYRIIASVVERWTRQRLERYQFAPTEKRYVNLFDGRQITRRKPVRTKGYDQNGHRYPEMIVDALSCIDQCLLNRDALIEHLSIRSELARQTERLCGRNSPAHNRAVGRLSADSQALLVAESQGMVSTSQPGIWSFKPAFTVQQSGRVSMMGGGVQTCTKHAKAALYDGIEELRNYDIVSSHPTLLRQLMRQAGIHCEWLDEYVDVPDSRQAHAAAIGLPADTFKQIVIALIYGSTLPSVAQVRQRHSAARPFQLTLEHTGTAESAVQTYGRVVDCVTPLVKARSKFFKYLRTTYREQNQRRSKRGPYLPNACGMNFYVDECHENDLAKKVLAHLLQGTESAFIHALTKGCSQDGVAVLSNEHDGLVVVGRIDEAAIQRARDQSGFVEARLIEKPFAPDVLCPRAYLEKEMDMLSSWPLAIAA
jgi:hypothetical protein